MEETLTQPLTIDETSPSLEVTLPQIENEIKFHLNQISQNIIEIGKRLIQAKSLVPHGQWQTWLQNNFKLSHSSAKNFMAVATRFGKSQSIGFLNSTQMITLLALPEADTEKFIEQKETAGTPVSDMSVKTLRKEIKQWKSETEKISPVQTSENKEVKTPDVTPVNSQRNQYSSEQTTSNEPYDTPLNNLVSTEPTYLESPAEIPGTHLIEELSSMTTSLIQHEQLNEIIQTFAKNNPSKLEIVIQNLTAIISKLQALSQKE